uniref:cytochrome b n=1 Tax=Aclerda takahashii TaxID=2936620 RepID=UPI002028A751|nr:cytochrome b [Aclerda takahashii]UPO69104.1 cytochrome b [Aclerda takahashii]
MKNMFNIKTPSNIYMWWNLGSNIMFMMMIQISTGLILSTNYMVSTNPFNSSINIFMNLNYGWLMRLTHSNLTSMIFIIILCHMTRSIMFNSFYIYKMWYTGMMLIIFLMAESFIGYSLIWNQMSYWAMMVITNFISTIPNLGKKMIKLLWGNFNINIILINRFFTIHFLVPALIMLTSLTHLIILHNNKSNNPMGLNNKIDLIKLNPLFIIKDLIIVLMILNMLMNIILLKPFLFSNSDNFIMMNYFKTPNHIEPEWYFMFFYSILRTINNKLSGLMILMLSFSMLIIMPMINKKKFQSFNPINKILMINLIMFILMISMMSKKNVEFPFKELNSLLIYLYFVNFALMNYMKKF